MNHTSVLNVLKENVTVVLVVKLLSSAYFSVMEKYIQKSFLVCAKATLQAIIRGRVFPEGIIHSDSWRG
jgi:hypothetical protein